MSFPSTGCMHVTPSQSQESAGPSWGPCVDSGFFAGPKEPHHQDSEGILEAPSPCAIKGSLVPLELKPISLQQSWGVMGWAIVLKQLQAH